MNRGPEKGAGSRADAPGFVDKLKARLAGEEIPDWLIELAMLCDKIGLKEAARELDYSAPTLSQVLNGKYPGNIERVEEVVRGKLMGLTVICPVLGEVTRNTCLYEQKQTYRATSARRAQLYRTCKTCIHRKGATNAE